MLGGMLIVFEVHLVPARADEPLLSDESLAETNAQVMTVAEAKAVGFDGLPNDDNVRLIAVASRDKGFVQSALERADFVTGFRVHEVDM